MSASNTVTTRSKSMDEAVADTNARVDFYERAEKQDLAPLWKVLAGLVPPAPRPKAVPHRWRYADIRPYLLEACDGSREPGTQGTVESLR